MADEYLNIKSWDPTGRGQKTPPAAPAPNATWKVGTGTAWVYHGDRNTRGITKPVILADGFHGGGTSLDEMWDGLERGAYPFITELRRRGHDLIILGFDDCTASILDNARVAQECIMRAIAERMGDAPLTVGGFSMGGLITRYALAKLEVERMDHQTALYISYDSPHHGAWMPIALQAMAHSLGPQSDLSKLVNSPAARQLLWRHIPNLLTAPHEDPLRTEFLATLKRFGDWPQRPRKLAVANGKGEGSNGIKAGEVAVSGESGIVKNVKLFTQATGKGVLVAQVGLLGVWPVKTNELPAADGAHGGQLEGFGLAADEMIKAGQVTCNQRWHSFVPTGSAIATAGFDPFTDLGASVLDRETEVDDFTCADKNEKHTLMNKALGAWILDRLPR